MTPRPRADRTAKRAELASVAAAVFADRGVANTAVSDIVKAAGVAQGTFYLYFDSKDEVVVAVVEQMVGEVVTMIEAAIARPGVSAVERFLILTDGLGGFSADPTAANLADFVHDPHNRSLHDRLTERLAERLASVVEQIVAQGVAEGDFDVPDTSAASWFVLAGLQSVELRGTPAAKMGPELRQAARLALRALGYTKELPHDA